MHREAVTSSNLVSVGYEAGVLEVEFVNGRVYRYAGVPAEEHRGLMEAESKGRHFAERIKGGGFEFSQEETG